MNVYRWVGSLALRGIEDCKDIESMAQFIATRSYWTGVVMGVILGVIWTSIIWLCWQ